MSDDPFIPLCVPEMGGGEGPLIQECVDTNWVSYVGPFVTRFEEELAAEAGAAFAVAMNSGTAALHVALVVAGVEAGDEVIMPAVTFVSPANAVRYVGAWPTFIDIDADNWQVDPTKVAEFLAEGCERRTEGLFNKATGRRVAAVMPVHLLGGMFDVDALAALAAQYDLPLIEDAAECLGATYKGRKIGAPTPSLSADRRYVCTSFNGNKIITTGGGGALITDDEAIATRAKHLSTTAKCDPIEFEHDAVGFNYRLTNTAAAMGVAQLSVLDKHVARKREIATRYEEGLENLNGMTLQPEPADSTSTFWMYTVLLDRPARAIVDALIEKKIGSRPIWKAMNTLPMFKAAHSTPLPNTERFCQRALSLPCSVGLEESSQQRVIEALSEIL